MKQSKKILVLGKGYAADFFEKYMAEFDPSAQIFITSRTKQDCICFDFDQEESWDTISENYDACVWTFPVYDLSMFQKFYAQKRGLFKKFILLGTTSSYKVEKNLQEVNEASPLDKEHKRYSVEQFVLKEEGIVLRAAGIYGPEKNPLRWVEQGRIKSGNKWVNWIHVEDLAQFITQAIRLGQKNHAYIAADGYPVQWQHVFEKFNVFPKQIQSTEIKPSKKVNSEKSVKQLQVQLKFLNLFQGIESISS